MPRPRMSAKPETRTKQPAIPQGPSEGSGKSAARKGGQTGDSSLKLTEKQARFVAEYVKDFNGKQAAIRAGYAPKSAEVCASQLLRHPKVASALRGVTADRAAEDAARHEEMTLSVDRTKREIARIAYFDPRKLFDEEGRPRPIHTLDDDTAAVIAGLKVVTKGNAEIGFGEVLEYKLADKNSALDKASKIHGAYAADNKQIGEAAAAALTGLAVRFLEPGQA